MKKILFVFACLLFSLFFNQTSPRVNAEEDIIRKNLVTIVNDVEVKRGATTSYPTVFTMKKDTRVYVRDTFVGNDGRKWVSVVTHGYKSGWALLDQFKVPTPDAGRKALITDQVDIRRGAHYGYASVATLPEGMIATQVDTFMTFSGQVWYKVDTGRKQGWLESQYFQNYMDFYGAGMITAKSGTLRKGASTDYPVRTVLSQGREFDTFVKFLNSRGEVWYLVRTYQNIDGWQGWIKSNEISVRSY
jgi:N-acetylmuramoyl-L-alanine amidase